MGMGCPISCARVQSSHTMLNLHNGTSSWELYLGGSFVSDRSNTLAMGNGQPGACKWRSGVQAGPSSWGHTVWLFQNAYCTTG